MGNISRKGLSIGLVVLFSGCGGPQQSSTLRAIPQTDSWRSAPQANVGDLIYAAGWSHSYVISAKTGKLIGTIDTGGQSVCSDNQGNVWLTGQYEMLEFAHGGTAPVVTLELPGTNSEPVDCAVDPTTGSLAVTVYTESRFELDVFADAQGTPAVYQSDFGIQFCGYDSNGNLFMDGYGGSGEELAELPKGGSAISDISLGKQELGGNIWSVQWDGKYVTVEGVTNTTATINRLQISGSTATVVGQTTFNKLTRGNRGSWIQGSRVLLPWGPERGGHSRIGVWPYPAGGKASKVFSNKDFGKSVSRINGLTVSVAQ